jgi:uncharacterized protein
MIRPFTIIILALLPLVLGHQPAPSPLLITEIDYDPPGRDAEGEWVELVYLGDEPLPLAGYKIGDEERMGQGEGMFRFPDDAVALPGQVIVIARNALAFRARFGLTPDFEFYDADPSVPDMRLYAVWATGDLFLANDGDELLLVGPDNVIRDAVNWGDSTYFFTPSVPPLRSGQSLSRSPAFCDRDSADDWVVLDTPTPGRVSLSGECPELLFPAPEVALTGPIGAIQGAGGQSPYLDQVVTFRGIVTGVQEHRNSRGAIFYTLFVQDDPGAADGDPATSDGIAVFTATAHPSFSPGDAIQVRGRVSEFYGLTEIDFRDLELIPLGRAPDGLPPPVLLNALEPDSLEPFEGMYVSLPQVRVAGATHPGCGFAVATLDTALPLLRDDPLAPPGPVLPVIHQSNVSCADLPDLKRGDLVGGLAGPLTYQFDQYQLVLQEPDTSAISPSPMPEVAPLPAAAPGSFIAITLNLHDYFAADPDLAIRRDKVIQSLTTYLGCPAIIALQEVESGELLQELAVMLGALCNSSYDVAHQDGPDARGLDVALLADASLVEMSGFRVHQSCAALVTGINDAQVHCPAGQSPLHSRPPLQVDVEIAGAQYSLFVNHLKSKREGEVETATWRLAQATHLADLVVGTLEQSPETAVLVMGDFNDLPLSAPLQALLSRAPLIDPLRQLPPATRYTYVFGGYAEALDSILLSPVAEAALVDAGIVHMNTDFPARWATDPATPYRASDHDVAWVTLRLPTAGEPAATATVVPSAALHVPAEGTPAPDPVSDTPQDPSRTSLPMLLVALGATAALLLAVASLRKR